MRADNCGDSRRARNAEVSQRVRELVLHAATSSRERAPTDAEMSSTQRRDRHQRRQRQRRAEHDRRRVTRQHRDAKSITNNIQNQQS